MQNRREKRKLLKKFGLLNLEKKRNLSDRIQEGKEKHRLNLQEMKNSEIKKSQEKGSEIDENQIFLYRNLNTNYDNLQSFLINKDWTQLEND
jgi:hypothetical protein